MSTEKPSVASHDQTVTLKVVEHFPSHDPREGDPHYSLFESARKALIAAGKMKCWVCGKDEAAAGEPIELHHSVVEFALANGIDIQKFMQRLPEFNVTDEESFLRFVESEANLLPLCVLHHRGKEGIHCIPYPIWRSIGVWRDDLPVPGELEQGAK